VVHENDSDKYNKMTEISQNENRWTVVGDINMDTANTLLEKSKGLGLADNTEVDLAQVSDVDTAAVSLMLEWHRRAMLENKKLAYINLPAGLTSLTALYGVTDLVS
jgi:phospholipid transport system transporter-binding protein